MSGGLNSSVMSDAGGTVETAEAMEMDWSHFAQSSRQHYRTSLNLESRGEKKKEDDRETNGVAIWKQMLKEQATPGDSWRGWLMTEVSGGVMLAAYVPEGVD